MRRIALLAVLLLPVSVYSQTPESATDTLTNPDAGKELPESEVQISSAAPVFTEVEKKGRWSGYADLDMGTNFSNGMSSRTFSNSSGSFSAWGMYSTDKFQIRLNLQGLSRFTATTIKGQTVNITTPESPQMNIDIVAKENTVFDEQSGVQMKFRPDARNTFSFNIGQQFGRKTPNKAGMSIYNSFSGIDYENVDISCSFNVEEVLQNVSRYNANTGWSHRFDKQGRELNLGIGWALTRNDKSSTWHITPVSDVLPDEESADEDVPEHIYRITPLYTENTLDASVLYRDENLFNSKSLHLELGADFNAELDKDNLSAANYVNQVWVDSLQYRENFDYTAIEITPKAKLSFSPGKFSFCLQLMPDLYINRLVSGENIGAFNFSKVYVLPDFNANWTPSAMHKLGIAYRQGVERPSYVQICGFPRTGDYSNEIKIGNPGLRPSSKGRVSLYYTFHSGFFTGTLEGMTTFKWDNIEQIFYNLNEYRVYTWINAGHSTDNSVRISMNADLKNFNAELGGYYNYFVGHNNVGDITRSSDWGLHGAASLDVKGGWTFNARGRYQSEITRSYNSTTEYIGCDVRVTKAFGKFSVYMEGKDLFDQTITVITYSEDHTYARIEDNSYNRRIFSIGATFKF